MNKTSTDWIDVDMTLVKKVINGIGDPHDVHGVTDQSKPSCLKLADFVS